MIELADEITVTVIVDNVTDSLSSTPAFVENEWSSHWRRGMKMLSGRCLCCAAHGFSCLIQVRSGTTRRTILFDTGPEDWVFERNVSRLAVPLGDVDAVVLSHGHWDHSGAMTHALQLMNLQNGGRRVSTYVHPGMFRLRASKLPDGSFRPMEPVPGIDTLTLSGAEVVSTDQPTAIVDGLAYVSGEIPRVTSFETGLQSQWRQTADGSGWEHDPLLLDERYVAVAIAGKGLVVFSACSHAGIVNVLSDVRRQFPELPILAVVGGLHLSGSNEAVIPQTVTSLASFQVQVLAVGHCTGWRAVHALTTAFGDAVAPSAVGKSYRF